MSNTVTIIKVRFHQPPLASDPQRTEYYFGSLSAIYDQFTPKQIGCKVERLWNYGIKQNKPYKNARCVVSRELMRRKTRRDNEEDV